MWKLTVNNVHDIGEHYPWFEGNGPRLKMFSIATSIAPTNEENCDIKISRNKQTIYHKSTHLRVVPTSSF